MFKRTSRSSRNPGGTRGGCEFEVEAAGGRGRPFAIESIFRGSANKPKEIGSPRSLHAASAINLLFLLATLFAAPAFGDVITGDNCSRAKLGCTANDGGVQNILLAPGAPTKCKVGQTIQVPIQLTVQAGNATRYDLGFFLSTDGKPVNTSGAAGASSCTVFAPTASSLPTPPGTFPTPFSNQSGDNDVCGDLGSGVSGTWDVSATPVAVLCNPNGGGTITFSGESVWDNNTNTVCTGAATVAAGTGSKCHVISVTLPVTALGTITIKKLTTPAGGGPFNFTFTGTGSDCDPTTCGGPGGPGFNLNDGQAQSITVPIATTATVTESTLPSGWNLNNIQCFAGSEASHSALPNPLPTGTTVTTNNGTRTLSAMLSGALPEIYCEYSNAKSATLTLQKTMSNTHGGTATSANFTPSIDGTATSWNTAVVMGAGSHTASETGLAGYTAGSWGGACAADGTVTLTAGQNATCTITNSDQAPTLTLVKAVSNTHGGTATTASFTPSIDGTATAWGTAVPLNAGSHTASETSLTGYTAGTWGGACATNGAVTLTVGQNATCTITNSDQPTTLTLVKTVSNTHGGTATTASFTPSIDATATAWGTAVAVNAGSHTASETSLAGYTAGSWGGECAAEGSVTLSPGQNATCTITNSDQPTTLTLVKTVSNTNGGTATTASFTPSVDGTAATWGTAVAVNAGSHTASETSLAGYTAGAWGGACAANGTVTLVQGQNATCTITNSDQAAHLTLLKTVSNTHGGTATAASFTPSIDGTATAWNTAVTLGAGAHTASETSLAGYTAGAWGGDCAANGTLTLTPGQNATCTITNSDQVATLTLVKTVTNTHGGTATTASFTPSIDGTATAWGTAVGVSAGLHTASETSLAGYTAGSWGGACAADGTVTLTAGQNATCTITNSDQVATLTLVKTVTNTHGGTATTASFTPSVDGTATAWGTAVTLNAGSHTATETALAGYTAGSWGGACAANGAVTLTVGQNATCTITNSDQAATLTLVKTVSNTHGGTATASSFTPSIDGTAKTWVTAVAVNAGAHTVSETSLAGYMAGAWGGACAANGTVTLVQGQNATCTITNSDQGGALTLVQTVSGASTLTSQVNGPFTYAVDCGVGSSATGTQTIVITGGASGNISLPAVQAGASCSVTQLTTAAAPSGATWGPPSYTASSSALASANPIASAASVRAYPLAAVGISVTIPANGTATVTIDNALTAQATPMPAIAAPLSRIWLLLFAGLGMLLTGMYFQRHFRN